MPGLSEDDLNLKEMSDEELALAFDLWFDLAQATNDFDPPYTHGVFQRCVITERDSSPGPGDCRVLRARPGPDS